MKKIVLGKTGIEVTELCFGVLPIGPLQKNLPVEEAARVLEFALNSGITFFDTAQMYQTYEPIRRAIKATGIRPVISTKSTAADYSGMKAAVEQALSEMELEYIDIFLLHAARATAVTFEERAGALQCLHDYKAKGIIGAVGISTHDIGVVGIAAKRDDIDIVFPILNKSGTGIIGGTRAEMEAAVESCLDADKGVFIMKALAGGGLINDYKSAIDYVREFAGGRAPIAIGMVAEQEVTMNIGVFDGSLDADSLDMSKIPMKQIKILDFLCKGCGNCAENCHSSAVKLISGKAEIDQPKCVKCGYCAKDCPQFAIRSI